MIEPTYADYGGDSIEVPDIEKFNWKTSDFRDFFQPAFDEIEEARDEWLVQQVLDEEHPRRVAEIAVGEQSANKIASLVNRGLEVSEGGSLDLVVSRTKSDAKEFLGGENREELLGIPTCCRYSDGLYETACASESAEAIDGDRTQVRVENPKATLNVFWQYMGVSLIDWVPHSFDCEASHEIAVRNGELLRELGLGEEADILWEWLSSPVTWSGYHALAHVRNGYSLGEHRTGDHWEEKRVEFIDEHPNKGMIPDV